MSDYEIRGLLLLLLINLIAALFVLVWELFQKQWKKGLIEFLFFALVPVVGISLFTVAKVINGIIYLFRQKEHEISEKELSFSKKRQKEQMSPDMEKGMNQVPVEEALLMSDKASKRQVFIDLLKTDDYDNSMEIIKDAVENEDMEIAHFAAAFVTDAQARYKEKEKELYKKCREGSQELWMQYCSYLISMLCHDIFSIPEKKVYLTHLEEFMELLRKEGALPGEMAAQMAEFWWEVEDEEKSEKWIGTAMEYSMIHLEAFKTCLKYYYTRQKKEEFFALLQGVKESSLALDHEALEWIRFFTLE